MPELLYEVGGNIYALFIMHEGRERDYVVGRDPENDFCLTDADLSVSGRHGVVLFKNGGFSYKDRNSRNGSFLQKMGNAGEVTWEPLTGAAVPLSPGDVLKLGEVTFLHFGEYLAQGSFSLAERLVEMFVATEREGGDYQEVLSTFLYRMLGIVLNVLQAREGLIEISSSLSRTDEDMKVSGIRAREIPHVRRGERAIRRTLTPEEMQSMEWKSEKVIPISRPWLRSVRKGDTVQYLFGPAIGKEFSRVEPLDRAKAMKDRALCVPLRSAARRIGVMYLAREGDARSTFTKADLDRAEDIGVLAGGVLDRLLARRGRDPIEDLWGNPEVVQTIQEWESNPALDDLPVLITGERGTGKELAARAIHHHSRRRHGPMVAVNAAIHRGDRLAPELFGTARGKFTDVIDSSGLFEVASGGTLFLDEIGETAPEAQAMLLRAVEQKAVTRIGGSEEIKVDVRIVAATNRKLKAGGADGVFRPDLLDRLSFLELHLKPVREMPVKRRRELLHNVLARMCHQLHVSGLDGISRGAEAALLGYPWLGNVREIEKELGNAAIRWSTRIDAEKGREVRKRDLSPALTLFAPGATADRPVDPDLASQKDDMDIKRAIEAVRRDYFERALDAAGGKTESAAKLLGLPVKTFYAQLAAVGIKPRGRNQSRS